MKDFARSAAKHSRFSVSKFWFVFVVIAFLVCSGIWMVIRAFHWSDVFASGGQQTALFVTEKVDQNGAFVARFLFDELRIEVYPIPSNVPVEVAGGYGEYRFQAVYPLLALEGKGTSHIQSTMSLSMGVLLDSVWKVDASELSVERETQLLSIIASSFWHNGDVPFLQRLALLSLAADQRMELEVHEPLHVLPAEELMTLSGQLDLGCTVALVNTTPLNGLAGRIASLLESQGFRVVRTISDTTVVEKTTLIIGDDLSADCQGLTHKLTTLVPGGVEENHDSAEALRNRADVVVKLGTDLVQ